MGDNVEVILGAIGQFWAKWWLAQVPRSASFFVVNQTNFRQLLDGRFPPNLVTKRISVSPRRNRKDICENFHFMVICPQNLTSKTGQTGTSLRAGYTMHCREIMFTPRCSARAREFPGFGQISLRRTVAELRGVKIAQSSDFGLFFPYKTPKTYLPMTSLYSPGVTQQNDFNFSI